MKNNLILLALTILLLSMNAYCQQNLNINTQGKKLEKKCKACWRQLYNMPREVKIGIRCDESENMFLVFSHKEWFHRLIKNRNDGFAIDILTSDLYDCSKKSIEFPSDIRGERQKPIYKKQLRKNIISTKYGEVTIKLGKIPQKFTGQNVELNLILLNKKYPCKYFNFASLKTYRWDLLDMGFYFDTLTHAHSNDSSHAAKERFLFYEKVFRFEIPFEQNQSEFSSTDINPLTDSLNRTDFEIKKITLRIYSSVEGSESRNKILMNERAEKIVSALQSYQKPSIQTEITVSENWVGFLEDILHTPYSYLAELSKEEIKDKLKDKKLETQIEPYLKNHRKAVIILELQKKDILDSLTIIELIDKFSNSIVNKNLENAIKIQKSIFLKVKNHEISPTYLDKLEIPRKIEFGVLLNKSTMFKYALKEYDVFKAYQELLDLQDLMPHDGHLKYNICALKLKIWLNGQSALKPETFRKEISDLKQFGIPKHLITRMLINYEIIMCEYFMIKGQFSKKDQSLKYIYSNFKDLSLTDADILKLAQYFSSYARYDWAYDLLKDKVYGLNIDENLLFYFINLTIFDSKIIENDNYKNLLTKAYDINPTRFCNLFKPTAHDRISFQLLEIEYLRNIYCEKCE